MLRAMPSSLSGGRWASIVGWWSEAISIIVTFPLAMSNATRKNPTTQSAHGYDLHFVGGTERCGCRETDTLAIQRTMSLMEMNDRLTRLEDALVDLAIVVTEGHLGRLASHMAPDVVEAGRRLQEFHRSVINERAF